RPRPKRRVISTRATTPISRNVAPGRFRLPPCRRRASPERCSPSAPWRCWRCDGGVRCTDLTKHGGAGAPPRRPQRWRAALRAAVAPRSGAHAPLSRAARGYGAAKRRLPDAGNLPEKDSGGNVPCPRKGRLGGGPRGETETVRCEE